MGQQQPSSCRCGRNGVDAEDADAESPVLPIADTAGPLAGAQVLGETAHLVNKRLPEPIPVPALAPVPTPETEKTRRKRKSKDVAKTSTGHAAKTGTAGEAAECPGMKLSADMEKAMTPLQKVRQRKADQEERANAMRGIVDDIMTGKFKKEGAQATPAADMRIQMPTAYERTLTRKLLLDGFRSQYEKLGRQADATQVAEEKTAQYSQKEVEGLAIKEGHRPMPRPRDVKLPKNFRKPIGTISIKTLKEFSCEKSRMLLSVYGDIFDVSDRPDKYGSNGPYSWMTGNDISWGFVSGKDTPEEINKFYDMWKIAPKELQQRKLTGLLAWVAFYEHEYGGAVGRLCEYEAEASLNGPPMEEAEECCVM